MSKEKHFPEHHVAYQKMSKEDHVPDSRNRRIHGIFRLLRHSGTFSNGTLNNMEMWRREMLKKLISDVIEVI